MNLKKFAIRGIVFLAVFVALCMFFSGTVRTITTPKVRLYTPKRGKLEERIDLACKPAFPDAEDISMALDDDTTLTIVKVNTRAGYTVEEGEVVIEAKVTGYDTKYKQLQDNYDAAASQLTALETKNRGIRINQRDQAYADAYYGLQDARHDAIALELEMDAQLAREKLARVDSGYPEGASDALKKLIDDWRAADKKLKDAQAAMQAASRYSVDETTWNYITERHEQQIKQDEAEQGLRQLMELNDAAKAIAAPYSGYIAAIDLKEGDTYDGKQALYSITSEDKMPTLRADLTDVSRTVTEGMAVTLEPDSSDSIDTKVSAIGTDSEGKKYADIALTKQIINAESSVYAMLQKDGGVPAALIYRARENSTLLDTSAVRGSGDKRTVLVAERNDSAFGSGTWKVAEMKVTVLGESKGITSIKEDLSAYIVVYGEDRAIKDGDTVMEYVNTASGDSDD